MFTLFIILSIVSGQYLNFEPNHANKTCNKDTHANPFNKQVQGANLGGWLVLEPWITPSLFYQFLSTQELFGDKAPEKTGMDMHSFCTALGSEEANRQLRLHWEKWVTEEDIKKMASFGINSLRIPVGDWMFAPYEPFTECTKGSIEALDKMLDVIHKYDIDVLIDIHAHRGSQNGFDNSGMSHKVQWTSLASTLPIGTTTFEHWPIREAEWVGTFDREHRNYSSINYENIHHSLMSLKKLTEYYKGHPAILGVQPINEPWELTPIEVLKQFYWDGYLQTKRIAPKWKFVMHDSFRFGTPFWGGFMKGCPDIALDTHIYQAWNSPGSLEDFFANACQQKFTISDMEDNLMPVIVGEWSLATDNCAMWLNGFNDNLPGFPKVQCDYIPCGVSSYLGEEYTGRKLDRTKPIQGPYGTGQSGPMFGKCPISNSNMYGDDDAMFRKLGAKKLNAFTVGHGFYFWNFKTELDSKWDFMRAVEKGWLPLLNTPVVDSACKAEDNGEFYCQAKRGVRDSSLESGLKFAVGALGLDQKQLAEKYPTLLAQCDYVFNLYWSKNRVSGATCDFGGAASLRSPRNAYQIGDVPITAAPSNFATKSFVRNNDQSQDEVKPASFSNPSHSTLSTLIIMFCIAGVATAGYRKYTSRVEYSQI